MRFLNFFNALSVLFEDRRELTPAAISELVSSGHMAFEKDLTTGQSKEIMSCVSAGELGRTYLDGQTAYYDRHAYDFFRLPRPMHYGEAFMSTAFTPRRDLCVILREINHQHEPAPAPVSRGERFKLFVVS